MPTSGPTSTARAGSKPWWDRRWSYPDRDRRTGFSVVLFGGHGFHYRAMDQDLVQELLAHPAVSSIQITFHPDKPPERHAMPPGGFRLAIVNCWDLEAGCEARRRLALRFWPTHRLRRRRRQAEGPSGAPSDVERRGPA